MNTIGCKHELKTKGQEAVLDLAILQYEKILEVYNIEASDRKKSPIVKDIINNITSLIKQAEKIHPIIVKANLKAQKALANGISPDLKTCNSFIDATAKFSELSHEYFTQKGKLDFYTDQSSNDLVFPTLTNNDTSAEYEMKRQWRKFA